MFQLSRATQSVVGKRAEGPGSGSGERARRGENAADIVAAPTVTFIGAA